MNEDSLVQTYIGRIVAWGSPLWLAIAAIIANAAQQWLNMDLDPTGVAAFVSTVVAAVAFLGYKWLHNLGVGEHIKLSALMEELIKLREQSHQAGGSGALTKNGDPVDKEGKHKPLRPVGDNESPVARD